MSLVAPGDAEINEGAASISVATSGGADIAQAPFMRDKASTKSFSHDIQVTGNTLKYSETTIVDIYGSVFEHTDESELIRIGE